MQSFRKDLTVKVTVSFDKEIEDKILHLLRQATKLTALSSSKFDKYHNLLMKVK